MIRRPDRSTTAGSAYLDLRKLANDTNRPTDELHQLYAIEGFLHRLTQSDYRGNFVLKGGVLLAAYAERRPTRDIDFAASEIQANLANINETTNNILSIDIDDGLEFNLDETSAESIRDDAIYPGVRAKVAGSLSTAQIRFHIDINIGDPLWPAPHQIELPRLLTNTPLILRGYTVELVLAEKIVTALQRGTANTRWRDFVDIAALSDTHVDNEILAEAIQRVAHHRQTKAQPLALVLDGYADIAQVRWSAWRRKQRLNSTPESFADLLKKVIDFSDPLLQTLD